MIIVLSQGCHLLKDINLKNDTLVTDIGIIALSEGCPDLEYVGFAYITNITDAAVNALLRGCLNLRDVDMYWTGVSELCSNSFRETHPYNSYRGGGIEL